MIIECVTEFNWFDFFFHPFTHLNLLFLCKIYLIQMFYFCTLLCIYIKSKHLNEGTVLSQLSHPVLFFLFFIIKHVYIWSVKRKSLKYYGCLIPVHVTSLIATDAHIHTFHLSDSYNRM